MEKTQVVAWLGVVGVVGEVGEVGVVGVVHVVDVVGRAFVTAGDWRRAAHVAGNPMSVTWAHISWTLHASVMETSAALSSNRTCTSVTPGQPNITLVIVVTQAMHPMFSN